MKIYFKHAFLYKNIVFKYDIVQLEYNHFSDLSNSKFLRRVLHTCYHYRYLLFRYDIYHMVTHSRRAKIWKWQEDTRIGKATDFQIGYIYLQDIV